MMEGKSLGPYAIDKAIGSGAMGTVFRARHTQTREIVAVKIISGGHETNANSVDRFKRETKILKKLNHPNIVRLHQSGRLNGAPFYIMEFIEGDSLEKALARRGRFTWEEVVTLGKQVCAALQHAHEMGIIHRDLKPANIMMTPDGTAKLTDFGIAKRLDFEGTKLTATNCTVGTIAYMSPEQCKGEPHITPKSDLYSLGVVFYQLLTGRLPFVVETPLEMFLAHLEGKFERPSRIVLDIPIWLDTLVCQLLEKDPEKRPLNAAMVGRALDEIQEKVAAQRSAGVEVVSARKADLPKSRRLREEKDREAARILKEAVTKQKIKRPKKMFYEKGWFLGVAVSALLLGLAWFTYATFFKTPSPDALYKKAKALMETNDPMAWEEARSGPIQKFLENYPDQADAQAKEIQTWADKIDLDMRERQLSKRMRLNISPEGEEEQTAYSATRLEDAGDLDLARQRWLDLQKHDKDPQKRPWALLGEKRLHELQAADQWEKDLRELIYQARSQNRDIQGDSDKERRAALAVNAEMFGDMALSLDGWKKATNVFQADQERRSRILLASKKVRELEGKATRGPEEKKVRLELLARKLQEGTKLKEEKPLLARVIFRDIVNLYGKNTDPEIEKLVDRAQKLLK